MKSILLVLCLVFSTQIFADHHKMKECKADMEKFCKDAEKKGKCMHEHKKELSAECQTAMKAHADAMKAKMAACKEDGEKFCKDIKAGDGKRRECLKNHMSELSEGCKVAMESKKSKK